MPLRLREAIDEDCRLLWEWANDPVVRAASFRSGPIEWEEHVRWFQDRERAGRRIYILMDAAQRPIGQVRFDMAAMPEALVDLSVEESLRGRGYGSDGLRLACAHLAKAVPGALVRALIKPDNVASLRTFERAGFIRCAPQAGAPRDVVTMRWEPVHAAHAP